MVKERRANWKGSRCNLEDERMEMEKARAMSRFINSCHQIGLHQGSMRPPYRDRRVTSLSHSWPSVLCSLESSRLHIFLVEPGK